MIDRILDKAEVAKALGKSPSEFDDVKAALHATGFPHPLGDDEAWRVIDLIDWTMIQQEAHLSFVECLTQFIDRNL